MKHYFKNIFIFLSLIFFLILLLVPKEIQAWTEPASSPPGGNIAAPINTSSKAQTKIGNLTIGLETNLNTVNENKFTVWGWFCWDGTCVKNWGGTGTYVLRQTNTYPVNPNLWGSYQDQGFAYLKIKSADQQAAFYGEEISNTSGVWNAGVLGKTDVYGQGDSFQYGVLGESQVINNPQNNPQISSAIGGWTDNSVAYAGYFMGNVGIDKNLDNLAGNLIMGDTEDYPGKICLYGDINGDGIGEEECKNYWPEPRTLWASAGNFTYLKDKYSNLATGGYSGRSGKFFVNVQKAGKGKVIIGQTWNVVPDGTLLDYTCGDGACNNSGETFATCPQDCNDVYNLLVARCRQGTTSIIRLRGEKPPNVGLIILRKETATGEWPQAAPRNGTSYNVGEIIEDTQVIYKSSPDALTYIGDRTDPVYSYRYLEDPGRGYSPEFNYYRLFTWTDKDPGLGEYPVYSSDFLVGSECRYNTNPGNKQCNLLNGDQWSTGNPGGDWHDCL